MTLPGRNYSDLSEVDRKILDFLRLGDEEGLTLGYDIACEVGVSPKSIGSRMVALERRGLVVGFPVEHYRATGWQLSDGAAETEEWRWGA